MGCTRELPDLREVGVWVGANCSISRHLGGIGRQFAWNLGSLPSRAHRWLFGDDGICGGPASASSIFWDAIALQHQAYVPGGADSDSRMPAARQFRDPGLPGIRSSGMVVAAGVRAYRNDSRHPLCGEFVRYLYAAPAFRRPGVTYRNTIYIRDFNSWQDLAQSLAVRARPSRSTEARFAVTFVTADYRLCE